MLNALTVVVFPQIVNKASHLKTVLNVLGMNAVVGLQSKGQCKNDYSIMFYAILLIN